MLLAAGNGRRKSNERIDSDVVNSPLDMKFQIISMVAVHLPLVNDDANLLWQPTRYSPELLSLRAIYCCIEHENSGSTVYGLSGRKRLIALATTAPSPTCGLTLDACLENLAKRRLRSASVSRQRFLDRLVYGWNRLRYNIPALDTQDHGRRTSPVGCARYDNSCIE